MTRAAERPQSRRLSIAHLALLIPWVVLVVDSWDPILDNSFLWHIRAGTVQADAAAVLTADPFSFTMLDEPWLTQSWLVELLYGWGEAVTGGLGFVPVMILLVGTLTFLAVGLIAYRRSQSVPATAFVLILTSLALMSFLVPRPVLFSYLLMALVVLAWDRESARWALPFLFWLWASVHASFIIGLAYVGLSLIMDREWRELPKAVVSGLTTLGTAHGLGVVAFLLDFGSGSDALQYLSEWRSPELLEPVFLPFLGGLVFIVIGAFRNRIFPRHLWLIVPFTLLGLSSVRAIPPAWLGLVPLVAVSLSGLELGSRSGLRPRLAAIFAAVVLVMPFLLIDDGDLSGARFPIEALGSLDGSRTFHDDVTGGFLIWAEGPERRVYIDDRAELYGDRMREFVQIRSGGSPWEPVFEREGIEQALLANEEHLIPELRAAGWVSVHEDDDFTVLRPGG
jgi:hypothetical protein